MDLIEIFDEIVQSKNDPRVIERIKEEYLNSFPPERQDRARRLQWKIDQTLRLCKDTTQRYNKMVEMFWEGVNKFQQTCELAKTSEVKENPNNIFPIKSPVDS